MNPNESFSTLLSSSRSILILLPTTPYFDQVAAALSLYLSLKSQKEVMIAASSPVMVEFNRLVAIDKVVTELGNKNLLIKFSGYKADNIERVSFDIDGDEGYLKIIPKPGIMPPQKETVELSYAGLAADLAILIGGGNETHFPALNTKDFLDVKLAHIGVRNLHLSGEKPLHSFARQASTISEALWGLLKDSQLPLDSDIATNLLMGIEEGTKSFTSPETTADTFQTFAELLRHGGRRVLKQEMPKRQNFPPGSIPGEAPIPVQPQQSQPVVEEAPVIGQPVTAPAMGGKPGVPRSWFESKIYKGSGDNSTK
jgi:hypothetical protein